MTVIDAIITGVSAIIKVVILRILKHSPLNRALFKESVVIKYNNSKKDRCYIFMLKKHSTARCNILSFEKLQNTTTNIIEYLIESSPTRYKVGFEQFMKNDIRLFVYSHLYNYVKNQI